MRSRAFAARIVFVVLAALAAAASAGAQGLGGIAGVVDDASGAVLPGVMVSLTSVAGTIGGNQQAVTDSRGAYQFARLVPGVYAVKAELPGFKTTVQEAVAVSSDVTARVDMRLELGQVSENIVVSGQAPLLDTTSALNQTVLSREVLDTLPNRTDVWSIARVIPSVIVNKVDVGGSESFLQSTTSVHGSSNENAYMVDGMEISSTIGVGLAMLYLDPFAFQESNYQTANGAAERSKGGVIFNMVTKSGTNSVHGGYMFSGANHGMGSANYSPSLRAQLLAAVPARVLAVNPDLVPGSNIQEIIDNGAWLAGPLVRNKLWFSVSAHHQVLNQYILGSYNPDGTQVLDDNRMWTTAAKVSWQVTRSSQLSYFNNLQYKLIGHRNGGGLFAESRARQYNYKYPQVNQVKWTAPLTSRFMIDAAGSVLHGVDMFKPEPDVESGDISHFDSVTNTYTVALPTYMDQPVTRWVFNASISYALTRHELKLGYQYMTAMLGADTTSTSGMRAVYRNGVPDSVNTYNAPNSWRQHDRDQGLYIQDKWTPVRKLTVNAGLRFEMNYGWQDATCQPETSFVAGQCFAKISGAPDFHALAPRLSAVYDLFGDGRTAIKAAANRYDIPPNISIVARLNPLATVNDTRAWTRCAAGQSGGCDLNGDLLPQLNELGPSTGFNFGVTNRYSPSLKWPVANEYSFEIQHQLPGNAVVSASYTRRETRRNIGSRNLAVPFDSYIPLPVTEATSGRPVTVYNQNPALRNRFDTLWDNYPELNTNYNGADLTINKRMSRRWMALGGVSFGRTRGDIYGTSDLNNPNFAFRNGVIGNDVPYSIRLSGAYQAPYQISVSATAQRTAGFPENTTVLVGGNTVTLTQVTQSIVVEPRGTTRLPTINSFDMSIRKTWRRGSFSVEPVVDLYNLGNAATILSRITQLGPTYGNAATIQRGRLIRAGVNVNF
jgi:hypothetical protein